MKNFVSWFFVIGSFVFLFWYVPLAVIDNMVTLHEMVIIGINVMCFIVNISSLVSRWEVS